MTVFRHTNYERDRKEGQTWKEGPNPAGRVIPVVALDVKPGGTYRAEDGTVYKVQGDGSVRHGRKRATKKQRRKARAIAKAKIAAALKTVD